MLEISEHESIINELLDEKSKEMRLITEQHEAADESYNKQIAELKQELVQVQEESQTQADKLIQLNIKLREQDKQSNNELESKLFETEKKLTQ